MGSRLATTPRARIHRSASEVSASWTAHFALFMVQLFIQRCVGVYAGARAPKGE